MAQDSVTRESIEALISDYEGALRATCPERKLPPEWQKRLDSIDRSGIYGLLKYWKWLAIFSDRTEQQRIRQLDPAERARDAAEAQEAARQLLTREPVELDLGGHVVKLTARSYRASSEIARHDRRIRLLGVHLAETERRMQEESDALGGMAPEERAEARRRLRRYVRLAERIDAEITRQRLALWSHALTPDGAPAKDASHVPDWWEQIDAGWDSALLTGLIEAGPVRYHKLGPAPEPKRESKPAEDLGWSMLFATIETRQKLEPAALYDRDLYQLMTWSRASAPPDPFSED